MAGQGRRLCDPRQGRHVDSLDPRLLFECRGSFPERLRGHAPLPGLSPVRARRAISADLRLLIAGAGSGRRIAMVREDRLCEFVVLDDSARALVGEILLGRIAKIDRGLEAAFVECDQGRTGFLPLRDAPSGVTEGQRLILQVGRAPVDGKVMRLTARPMLSRYRLSFAPFAKGVIFPNDGTVSEQAGLQRAVELLGQAARGLSLRRQAIGAEAAALLAEAELLKATWAEI